MAKSWKQIAVVVAIVALMAMAMLHVNRSRPVGEPAVAADSEGPDTQVELNASPAQASTTPGLANPMPEPLSTSMPTGEEAARASREIMKVHEGTWNLAPADPQGAAEVERKIAEAMDAPVVAEARSQPTDMTGRCKASMCRIEATFPGNGDPQDWLNRMLLALGPTFGSVTNNVVRVDDKTNQLVVYAYRAGHPPPKMPQ